MGANLNIRSHFIRSMMRIFFFAEFIVFMIVIAGCGDNSSSDDVVRFGRVSFSQSSINQLIDARVALTQYQLRVYDKDQLEKIRKDVSSSVGFKIKQDFVVSNYLEKIGIAVPEEAIQRQVCRIFKSKKRADEFLSKQSIETQFFIRDFVRADIALELMRSQVVAKAEVDIADEKVRKVVTQIERLNAIANATNALVYASASNCWHEIQSGRLTFHAASLKYENSADLSNERAYWGEFPLSALTQDVGLCRVLPEMKLGEVTPPIEADNGLCIIQLIDIVQNKKKGSNLAPEAYYRLNRIFFELPVFYETPTMDNVRLELRKKEESRVFSEFMKNQYKHFGF